MGRGKAPTADVKAKKPKTEIQRKREERRAKKPLPRAVPLPSTTPPLSKDKKNVKPKPKPQNPGFMKWSALFKRELVVIETHIKHAERFRQHWRAELDKMEPEDRKKWESGEVGNWVRLQKNLERSREILALAREANAWIVPPNKLGLNKQGLGMKDFVLGADAKKKEAKEAKAGGADSSSEESDSMDTEEEAEAADSSTPEAAEFTQVNISRTSDPKTNAAAETEDSAAKSPVEPNPYFMVDTNPTPVNLNDTLKKGKKRSKEYDDEEPKVAKRSKKEKTVVVPAVEPQPQADSNIQTSTAPEKQRKRPNVDFSAIEAQLQAEIEAGQKAKEERAAAKLAKKEKKRKRISEGDSRKEIKKPKESKEKKKRKAEESGDEVTVSDEGVRKQHKVAG